MLFKKGKRMADNYIIYDTLQDYTLFTDKIN